MSRASRLFLIFGPGLLVAATGVGAGDLATASFAGAKLGMSVLWAVLWGAGIKFVLSEGLTRFQLVTGRTLLEGVARQWGRPLLVVFLVYFLAWSFLVSTALMSGCGAAALAILPLGEPTTDKIIYGIVHSILGVFLVRFGGYRLFEKLMRFCIAFMFVVVMVTAVLLLKDIPAFLQGLFIPTIPATGSDGVQWTVALMGGVGGTVTILCYGYWIREERREKVEDLGVCRIDLLVGYLVTALFGVAMVVIGTAAKVEGRGVGLIVTLAGVLEEELGTVGKWAFLLGAWGAIASSLLGVWQSVPYLFADIWRFLQGGEKANVAVDTNSRPYRYYLYGFATIPAVGLWIGFVHVQKLYAILGAMFLPLLSIVLLLLNGRSLGKAYRNRPLTVVVLGLTLCFFLLSFWFVVS